MPNFIYKTLQPHQTIDQGHYKLSVTVSTTDTHTHTHRFIGRAADKPPRVLSPLLICNARCCELITALDGM